MEKYEQVKNTNIRCIICLNKFTNYSTIILHPYNTCIMHEQCYNEMGNVIINRSLNNYKYDPVKYLNFNEYITTKNVKFSWGLESIIPEYIKNLVNIVVYFEEPNFLDVNEIDHCSNNYDIKLTLCKFTSEEFNKKHIDKKCYNVFFPIDILYLKNNLWDKYQNYNIGTCIPYWKNINVIYTGHDVNVLIQEFKKIINKYNNCIMKIPDYLSKMDAYLHSKIAIVHNLLFYENENNTIQNIKTKLPVFKDKNNLPQLKSRVFEAAFSQCIILCYKDEYNTIEDYFKEGEDFIYFNSTEHLEQLIPIILKNYNKFVNIGLNAYQKCFNNYTLKHFCDKFINIY